MEITPDGSDEDIEDVRSQSGGGGGFGFGGGGGFGGVHLGIGGVIVVGLLSLLFRQNLFDVLNGGGSVAPAPSRVAGNPSTSAEENRRYEVVKFTFNDAQKVWDQTLPRSGAQYRHATLVLYRDAYPSGCGQAQSAVGPFYCPEDEKVYIDLGFFDELQNRFGASGDFAQAYVVAHEIGHHVQKILGIEQQARRLQRGDPRAANPVSVRLELQADCLAGVWAHSSEQRRLIDNADIDNGLRAAAAVGDDHIQKMTRGQVSPESFTHGSSADRSRWFRTGLESGEVGACNTFQQR